MKSSWRFGLLGEHIGYTKSPDIFAAIGKHLNFDIQFEIHDVSGQHIPAVLDRVRDRQMDGLSVTIPHKEAVRGQVDRCSQDAEAIGAVNCVVNDAPTLLGHNTDWQGFLQPLLTFKSTLDGARVVIIGSGGAARAAMYGLKCFAHVREFVVISRNPGKRTALVVAAGGKDLRELTFDQSSEWKEAVKSCSLMVNATPLGGGNYPVGGALSEILSSRRDAIYYDLNYNDNNELVQMARRSGGTVIDGKSMLVAQALKSFTLWAGLNVSFEPIYQSVFGAQHK